MHVDINVNKARIERKRPKQPVNIQHEVKMFHVVKSTPTCDILYHFEVTLSTIQFYTHIEPN